MNRFGVRFGWLIAIVLVLTVSAGVANASRSATPKEQVKIAAAVELKMRQWADSPPTTGISHGTKVVLFPICVSTADSRYGLAIANPVDYAGQYGLVFVRRTPAGYQTLGKLLTAGQASEEPPGLSQAAYADLHQTCAPADTKAVLRAEARHTAPVFVT
jgi:hypothetical protein